MAENFPKIIKDLFQSQEPQGNQAEFKNKQQKNEIYYCQTAENEQGRGNIDDGQRKRTHYIQETEMRKNTYSSQKSVE